MEWEFGSEIRQGMSKRGEDRVVVVPDMGLFGVFDGHRGPQVSEYAAQHFPQKLRKQLELQKQHATIQEEEEYIKNSLRSAILETDQEILQQGDLAGSTACVAVVTKSGLVVVANVGDSRALAFESNNGDGGDSIIIELSQDHQPRRADERARIEAAGGRIMFNGISYRLEGSLAITRALGDPDYKRYGLVAEPEFRVWSPSRDRRPCFLVVASDGVFEKLSVKAVRKIVDELKNESVQGIATAIVERGVRVDDISAIVVKWPC